MEKRNPGGSVFCKHALPVRTKIQRAYKWDDYLLGVQYTQPI